jgi:hypothetical protein
MTGRRLSAAGPIRTVETHVKEFTGFAVGAWAAGAVVEDSDAGQGEIVFDRIGRRDRGETLRDLHGGRLRNRVTVMQTEDAAERAMCTSSGTISLAALTPFHRPGSTSSARTIHRSNRCSLLLALPRLGLASRYISPG